MKNGAVMKQVCVMVLALAVLVVGWGAGATTVSAEKSVQELTKELKGAVRAKNTSKAGSVIEALAASDDPKALDAMINYGLRANNYDLERLVGKKLMGKKGAALDRICYHANKNKAFQIRVVLTLVLAKRSESEAFGAVLKNLYDKVPSVVLAALEGVTARRQASAIGHLIQALDYQEQQGGGGNRIIKFEIRKALNDLTDQDLSVAADWRNWWEPRKKNFQVPPSKRKGKKKDEQLTGVRSDGPDFFNIEVADDKVIFIMDISGSMKKKDALPEEPGEDDEDGSGAGTGVGPGDIDEEMEEEFIPESRQRIIRVQAELIRVIKELPKTTRFNIITFNHNIEYYQDGLILATNKNKDEAIRYVDNFEPEGQTHTDEALRAAFEMNSEVSTIFLLSDGAPRRDDVLLDTDPILKEVKEMNRFRRTRLHTIGFEQAGSNLRRFMRKLAKQNHGEFVQLR